MTAVNDPVQQIQEQNAEQTQRQFASPYEFLATIPGAPDKAKIEAWKLQTPNGRLRVFTPDAGKRVFIVRAVGGMELGRLQAQLPENLAPQKAEMEVQCLVASACVLWTNATGNGKLTADELRNGSAGLPASLFNLISWLSDFVDPEAFGVLSAEL